jgi:quinol monooxygenase YgiN
VAHAWAATAATGVPPGGWRLPHNAPAAPRRVAPRVNTFIFQETKTMADTCCTLVPYFKVHEGRLDDFKRLCAQFEQRTGNEAGCLHYAFSFDGDAVHCREGYVDAAALLHHLDNVGPVLQEALKIADVTRLEVHAPAAEVEKLRAPLAGLNPQFFVVEGGFRR